MLAKNMKIRPKEKQVYRIVTSPEEVLEAVENLGLLTENR